MSSGIRRIRALTLAAIAAFGCGSSEPAPARQAQPAAGKTRAPAVAPKPPEDAASAVEPADAGDPDAGNAPASPAEEVPARPRVIRIMPVEEDKTRVTIDRGRRHGVEVGFRGQLVTREGKVAPGGFEVYRVTRDDCDAVVEMPPDEVRRYRFATLSPP